jgi:hypothetical protein
MTITITFPESTEQKLRERAAEQGQDVGEYVRSLVEKDLGAAAAAKTITEILTPVWEGFAQSGMTEDEIARMFEHERQAAWQERQKETPPK